MDRSTFVLFFLPFYFLSDRDDIPFFENVYRLEEEEVRKEEALARVSSTMLWTYLDEWIVWNP